MEPLSVHETYLVALAAKYVLSTLEVINKYLQQMRLLNINNEPIYLSSVAQTCARKRRREVHESYTTAWEMLNLLRSYLVFHREITCPWYIKPRQFEWVGLFLDFITLEDPERFKTFFIVSPQTFHVICEMVHDDMVTDPPLCFCVLPNRKLMVERQVAIGIRRLATSDQFAGIAELHGVSKTTAIKATWKFIKSFNARGRHLIKWPIGEDMAYVKSAFQNKGFPNCCGAVDGTHFQLEVPAQERSEDYFDFKHKLSVSMQAIVDLKLRFLDVMAGWPGSIQDTRLLRCSKFYAKVVFTKELLEGDPIVLNETYLKEYILGDAGYPLYRWLIVPFTRGQSVQHEEWNHKHSSARMCVERAFGRLKGVWRILSRTLWRPNKLRVGHLIFCCCLLHNLMIERGEVINPALLHGIEAHPPGYGPFAVPTRAMFEGGVEARNVLYSIEDM